MSVSSFKYTSLNSNNPLEDYYVRLTALDCILMDPESRKDPEVMQEVVQRKAALEAEAIAKGILKGRSI